MKLTVNGKVAYAYTGGKDFDPSLPCLIFVHGAVNDHTVWTLLARWFAHHGYAVLAVDLPGHMRSSGPALITVEEMADWLQAFMDAAGVKTAAVAGHSMGSLVALATAAKAPDRVTHLGMLASCVPMPVSQALLDLSRQDVAAAIDRAVSFSFSSLAAKPSYPGPGVWLQGAARSLMHQVMRAQGDALLFHTDFSVCNAYQQGLQHAQAVRCPAALVLGQYDQMTLPKAAHAVAKQLKERVELQVHELPAGHYLMQEQPDRVLNALRSWLSMSARPS